MSASLGNLLRPCRQHSRPLEFDSDFEIAISWCQFFASSIAPWSRRSTSIGSATRSTGSIVRSRPGQSAWKSPATPAVPPRRALRRRLARRQSYVQIEDFDAYHRELPTRPNRNMNPGVEDPPCGTRSIDDGRRSLRQPDLFQPEDVAIVANAQRLSTIGRPIQSL
jgi:hypothetical protein